MSRMYECPFFGSLKKGVLSCEAAVIRFKDLDAMKRWLDKRCSKHPGWKDCPMAQAIEEKYERT